MNYFCLMEQYFGYCDCNTCTCGSCVPIDFEEHEIQTKR